MGYEYNDMYVCAMCAFLSKHVKVGKHQIIMNCRLYTQKVQYIQCGSLIYKNYNLQKRQP